MKSVITVLLLLISATAHAETFYQRDYSHGWSVYGTLNADKDNFDKCTAEKKWDDGSLWQLTKNLNDGTVYIAIRNTDWQITDDPQTQMVVQINAYQGKKFVGGSGVGFTLNTKNTMYSQSLAAVKFIEAMRASDRMVFIPPGNIPNMNVSWNGRAEYFLNSMADCIDIGNPLSQKSRQTSSSKSG